MSLPTSSLQLCAEATRHRRRSSENQSDRGDRSPHLPDWPRHRHRGRLLTLLRAASSPYSDSTIRTMMTSHMCVDTQGRGIGTYVSTWSGWAAVKYRRRSSHPCPGQVPGRYVSPQHQRPGRVSHLAATPADLCPDIPQRRAARGRAAGQYRLALGRCAQPSTKGCSRTSSGPRKLPGRPRWEPTLNEGLLADEQRGETGRRAVQDRHRPSTKGCSRTSSGFKTAHFPHTVVADPQRRAARGRAAGRVKGRKDTGLVAPSTKGCSRTSSGSYADAYLWDGQPDPQRRAARGRAAGRSAPSPCRRRSALNEGLLADEQRAAPTC